MRPPVPCVPFVSVFKITTWKTETRVHVRPGLDGLGHLRELDVDQVLRSQAELPGGLRPGDTCGELEAEVADDVPGSRCRGRRHGRRLLRLVLRRAGRGGHPWQGLGVSLDAWWEWGGFAKAPSHSGRHATSTCARQKFGLRLIVSQHGAITIDVRDRPVVIVF